MASVAPNLATLIGETVGARLISHAGSLTNLAKYPASTVQILGAEKALFRALKTKGNKVITTELHKVKIFYVKYIYRFNYVFLFLQQVIHRSMGSFFIHHSLEELVQRIKVEFRVFLLTSVPLLQGLIVLVK